MIKIIHSEIEKFLSASKTAKAKYKDFCILADVKNHKELSEQECLTLLGEMSPKSKDKICKTMYEEMEKNRNRVSMKEVNNYIKNNSRTFVIVKSFDSHDLYLKKTELNIYHNNNNGSFTYVEKVTPKTCWVSFLIQKNKNEIEDKELQQLIKLDIPIINYTGYSGDMIYKIEKL